MPLPFYLTCIAIVIFGCIALSKRKQAWGLPAAMVLGTVSVWYVGDVLYNDYNVYLLTIGLSSITSAWWQVLLFVITFGLLVSPINRLINGNLSNKRSYLISYLGTKRLLDKQVQHRIDLLGKALLSVWLILMVIALVMVNGDVVGLFAPYLGRKAEPWARGQIGGGFSALISLASYLQLFLAAAFGVLAALAQNPRTRNIALVICALTLPYYIFDRSRHAMVTTVVPGVLAYVFMRVRGGILKKSVLLLVAFLIVNFWLTAVMANRSGMSFDIAGAISGNTGNTRHEGLNMFQELAWIDSFIESGDYSPNHGQRYFAELVNPIPRGLWKNKPMIGLDYALARGQIVVGSKGEMSATISTGMIGQGVVNFGRIGGPIAAAVLMSLWVAILARQDLLGNDPGRLFLYITGMILTFNFGRDISLIGVYPFFFGLGLFLVWKHFRNQKDRLAYQRATVSRRTQKESPPSSRPPIESKSP